MGIFTLLCMQFFLVRFLRKVALKSSINMMGPTNLGTVIGPNILRPKAETTTTLLSNSPAVMIEKMIEATSLEAFFSNSDFELAELVALPPMKELSAETEQERMERIDDGAVSDTGKVCVQASV